MLRQRAARTIAFNFAKQSSMGLRSGLYGGRYHRVASARSMGATDAGGLVHAEVIRDDDVARPQRGHQDLVDVGQEAGAVDRAIEDARRGQAGDPERREKRTGLPSRARRVIVDPGATRGAAVPPEEIGGDAGFVEKDEAGGIPGGRPGVPRAARGRDVRPIVFGRPHRFF